MERGDEGSNVLVSGGGWFRGSGTWSGFDSSGVCAGGADGRGLTATSVVSRVRAVTKRASRGRVTTLGAFKGEVLFPALYAPWSGPAVGLGVAVLLATVALPDSGSRVLRLYQHGQSQYLAKVVDLILGTV